MVKTRRTRAELSDPLGDILRRARHNHVPPLTQEDVASSLGKRQSTVSSWESGKARPDLTTLGELARLLDLDLGHLAHVATTANAN